MKLVLSVCLFVIFLSPQYVDAKTFHVYVADMPKHWEQKFGNLMYDSTKFWENRYPGLQFNQVEQIRDADFVVQWASEYQGNVLGYYTPDTKNDYGKPYIAITLGYMDDESVKWQERKFNLVDSDYALEITKHEIGHAIGLDHSSDPDDIMYPSIYYYDDWLASRYLEETSLEDVFDNIQQSLEQKIDLQYKDSAYLAKSNYENLISELNQGIIVAESSLSGLSLESTAAQEKIDEAWDLRWQAVSALDSAEKNWNDGLASIENEEYLTAKSSFEKVAEKTESVDSYLRTISSTIDDAMNLESQHQKESSPEFCFLFWCW